PRSRNNRRPSTPRTPARAPMHGSGHRRCPRSATRARSTTPGSPATSTRGPSASSSIGCSTTVARATRSGTSPTHSVSRPRRTSTADEVANANDTLATKRRAVEAASRAVELANESLRLVRAQYEAGTAKQLDVLQAQDSVVVAEVGLAQAHFEVSLADVQLRR